MSPVPACVLPAEGDTTANANSRPLGHIGWSAQTTKTRPATDICTSPWWRGKVHAGEGDYAAKSAAEMSGKPSENSRCLELGWL